MRLFWISSSSQTPQQSKEVHHLLSYHLEMLWDIGYFEDLWSITMHHHASRCISFSSAEQPQPATACHSSRYYTRAPTVRTTGWASTTWPGHGGGGSSSTSRSWAQRSTEQTTTTVQATVPQATLPPWLETYTPTGPMRTEMTLSTSSREDAEDAWFKNCRKDSHPAGCECILWLVIRQHVWRIKWKWQALEPWFIKLLQEMNVHYGYKGLQDPNDINIIGISGISICYRHQFPLIFDTVHRLLLCSEAMQMPSAISALRSALRTSLQNLGCYLWGKAGDFHVTTFNQRKWGSPRTMRIIQDTSSYQQPKRCKHSDYLDTVSGNFRPSGPSPWARQGLDHWMSWPFRVWRSTAKAHIDSRDCTGKRWR